MKDITPEKALRHAAALCGKSEHCRHELKEKMLRWGLGEDEAERVLDRLTQERFLDEKRYARAYALDKLRYNHWGRRKIEQMLRFQHVPQGDILAGLAAIGEDEYRRTARQTLRAKLPSIQARDDYERTAKLIRFALGRGFEMDIIQQEMPQSDT